MAPQAREAKHSATTPCPAKGGVAVDQERQRLRALDDVIS